MNLALHLDMVIIRDRETGTEYALHNDCHELFEAAMSNAGIDTLSRFAMLGSISGEACNWGACSH